MSATYGNGPYTRAAIEAYEEEKHFAEARRLAERRRRAADTCKMVTATLKIPVMSDALGRVMVEGVEFYMMDGESGSTLWATLPCSECEEGAHERVDSLVDLGRLLAGDAHRLCAGERSAPPERPAAVRLAEALRDLLSEQG